MAAFYYLLLHVADNQKIQISTTVTHETLQQIEDFKHGMRYYADLVSVGRTQLNLVDFENFGLNEKEKERLIDLKSQESLVKTRFLKCPEVFDKLTVFWDGRVTACCGDYNGLMVLDDISNTSLKEIWQSEILNRFRYLLVNNKYDELDLCKNCYDVMSIQSPGVQGT